MANRTIQRRSAFTLVELLVVIGIIAALIAMLLPALTSARKSAQMVKCLSNLRQQGQILFMYAADHRGKMPFARVQLNGKCSNINGPWPALMCEGYIRTTAIITGISRGFQTPTGAGSYAPPFLQCPAEPSTEPHTNIDQPNRAYRTFKTGNFRNATGVPIMATAGGDEGSAVYGYAYSGSTENYRVFSQYSVNMVNSYDEYYLNQSGGICPSNKPIKLYINGVAYNYFSLFANFSDGSTGNNDGGSNAVPDTQKSLSQVRNAADTWMAWDGTSPLNYTGLGSLSTKSTSTLASATFRHPNLSCNFVYFDGHAENIPSSAIDANANSKANLPGLGYPSNNYVIADVRVLPAR